MHENWYQVFFRSGNPFLKSKIPKNESFRESIHLEKNFIHTLATNVGMLANGCKKIFCTYCSIQHIFCENDSFFYLLFISTKNIKVSVKS